MKSLTKTSKTMLSLLLCLTLAAVCFVFTACGEPKITSMQVKSGTMTTTIVKNSELDTTDLVVIFTYDDNSTKEVAASNLEIGSIDTSTTGNKNLSITYEKNTYNIVISVVPTISDTFMVASLKSQLITDYNNNKSAQTNKQEEFYDLTQPLYVGNDNAFNFRIIASGTEANGDPIANLTQVRTVITVELKNKITNKFEPLTGTALENMVAINTEKTTLTFTNAAENNTFKVTVAAANADPEYEEADTSFTATLNVVEGYNVYNAIDLYVFDNVDKNGVWTNFKTAKNLPNVSTNAVILQNDINITKNDVPSEYFWKTTDTNFSLINGWTDQTLEGSLIDESELGIYERTVSNGSEFNFIGNYFAIKTPDFPKIVAMRNASSSTEVVNVESGQGITSHTCLFKTYSAETTIAANTSVNYKNIYFIGNATTSNDITNSGGLLLMKNNGVNFYGYNTLAHNFYIVYFFEMGEKNNPNDGHFEIDKTKSYNSYQNQIYSWGAENILIKNSEIIGAGGPAIIADHHGFTESGGQITAEGYVPTIDIINTKIEAKINGTEPWFEQYPGSGQMAAQMLGLEAFFDGSAGLPALNKTIIADTVNNPPVPRMNAIVLLKRSGEGLSAGRCYGFARIFDTQADYNKFYDATNPEKTVYGLDMNKDSSLIDNALTNSVTYIEASGNGIYINQGFGSSNVDSNINLETEVFYDQGNYLNIYSQIGMGFIIQLKDIVRG